MKNKTIKKSLFETTIEKTILSKAKDQVWNALSKKERSKILKETTKEYWETLAKSTMKDINKMNKVMDDPNYVSRADPSVYKRKR